MEVQDGIIVLAALGASLLTLLSGFGLGTLLLPVFALFFPLPVAVLLTAVVHLLNNLFKLGLLWRHIDGRVVLLFGVPGIVGALLGAWLLELLGTMPALYAGVRVQVDALHLALAVLMVLFAITELVPAVASFSFAPRHLLPGGFISGLLGGFSGHQGALRTMFLLRAGLSKQAFLATGVATACVVDLTRIPVYLASPLKGEVLAQWPLLCAATVAAFVGAYWGKQLIPKVTLRSVQLIVAAFMMIVAVGLASGVI